MLGQRARCYNLMSPEFMLPCAPLNECLFVRGDLFICFGHVWVSFVNNGRGGRVFGAVCRCEDTLMAGPLRDIRCATDDKIVSLQKLVLRTKEA